MIRRVGYVSRVFGAAVDDASYQQMIGRCVNFIGVDAWRETGWNGGQMKGVLELRAGLHHHHKRADDCEHGLWSTDEALGHHHHKRGEDCEHGEWATDDVGGHHHHKRGEDCEHGDWATDDQILAAPVPAPGQPTESHHHHKLGHDCDHGEWATSVANGHHHHKRGRDCEHGCWATDDVAGHHHHERGTDCIAHKCWATDGD